MSEHMNHNYKSNHGHPVNITCEGTVIGVIKSEVL